MNLLYNLPEHEFHSVECQKLSPLKGWLCNHGRSSREKLKILEQNGFDQPLLFEGETPLRKFVAYIDPDNKFSVEDKLSQVRVNTLLLLNFQRCSVKVLIWLLICFMNLGQLPSTTRKYCKLRVYAGYSNGRENFHTRHVVRYLHWRCVLL